MGPGPDWVVAVADETDLDARRQARIDAALQAGWVIRHDPLRGEFTAARELHVGRTIDDLLAAVESA
jgi:hypothetical protein